jgi:hypothetical protein
VSRVPTRSPRALVVGEIDERAASQVRAFDRGQLLHPEGRKCGHRRRSELGRKGRLLGVSLCLGLRLLGVRDSPGEIAGLDHRKPLA